ncbi:MAG: hypothetical protein O2815_08400 [Actinomycetota bacterium]|nr:hypothetical protein [Actinomycetota bacterium]
MNPPPLPKEMIVKTIAASHPAIADEVKAAGPLLNEDDLGLVHRLPLKMRRSKFLHPITEDMPDGEEPLLVRFERDSMSVNLFIVQPVEFWDSLIPVGSILNTPSDLAHLPDEDDIEFIERRTISFKAFATRLLDDVLQKWEDGRHPKVETMRVMGHFLNNEYGDQVAVRTVVVALRSIPPKRRPSRALSDLIVSNLRDVRRSVDNGTSAF